MKRLFLYCAMLLLTFAIGVFANAVVLRAAYYFIPDFDPLPAVEAKPAPGVFIECGRNRHLRLKDGSGKVESKAHYREF